MILEGIVTTIDDQGLVNVAPMGPVVPEDWSIRSTTFELRPFKTSRTYRNLKQVAEGVLHVTDDVLLLAQAVINQANPRLDKSRVVKPARLSDCCRFWEFRISDWDESSDRTRLTASVVHSEVVREFFGFNRAKSAVVEAAILISRIGILEFSKIAADLERLRSPVEKTGGATDVAAFNLLYNYAMSNSPVSEKQSADLHA